ncbi:MAG: mechanosensitive ion channel family protein [Balneolaceae bacterium]
MNFKNPTLFLVLLFLAILPASVSAQDENQPETTEDIAEEPVPAQVDVEPAADDTQIRERLSGILKATGWFTDTEVEVNDGVVFLKGLTETDDYKNWAGDLARNTQDVAAVVNQIEVTEPDIWNYEPAFAGLQDLWRSIMRSIPFWIFGLLVLLIFWGIAVFAAKVTRSSLRKRKINSLLQDIAARIVAVVVFLLGIYIVFHVADLTGVAFTVLGGTGLLGIVLGIAFRDITENFLASIFLSIQNPFHAGDLVEITGHTGFVQRLTIRATLLITLDGNHMQIPNSTVYKSSILNFTSNPNQRSNFIIGIGYEDKITAAQEIGSKILAEHPAVLNDPEPWILVDELAASTVNLKFYLWLDGSKHNLLKVKSSVMRLVKAAYQKEGISMPDEAREMTFPDGVPVQLNNGEKSALPKKAVKSRTASKPDDETKQVSSKAEGGLESNAGEIQEQARKSRVPEEGENLLKS